MEQITETTALRDRIAGWRKAGERIAFVPTMGNLHEGHLRLVQRAHELAPRRVVSIFVNPLQFGEGEDFGAYPRTLEADAEALRREGADLLYTPTVEGLYPRGQEAQTRVEVPGLSNILCGASRPGHFVGVATVVCKLFNLVQPDVAIFGEKDFQQLLVIRRMTEDLCLPVEIVGAETVREPDGLALSSRNGYLTPEERRIAPKLYAVLRQIAEGVKKGEEIATLETLAEATLRQAGFVPDYLTVRTADDLAVPTPRDNQLVVLGAAWLGRARLIDNLKIQRNH
ncbi:MAG TPA: pantoate--beta-alanine ligase [Chromatiales bacterium]|nr:pantoate--beta-alanine ligase [Chromatiales bacterium]